MSYLKLSLIACLLYWPVTGWSLSEKQPWSYLQSSKLKWQTYDTNAFDQARKQKKPIFLFVFLDTCHWCHKYETETLETPKITKRLQQDYLPVAIDSAKQPELLKKLDVQAVPTTILITPDGRKIVKFQGHVDVRDLADILDANLYRWRKGEIVGDEFGDPKVCCPVENPTPTKK